MFLSQALATPLKKANDPRLKTSVLNAATIFNVYAFLHGICE